MKESSIRKSILSFVFVAYALITEPLAAAGLATGPYLGTSGFYTSFDAKPPSKKITIDNMAIQLGWSVKLDLWLLYAKLDPAFVFDWRKLPDQIKSERELFQSMIVPFTVGIPCFGLFRPHIGLIFRINLHGYSDAKFKGHSFVKLLKEHTNGFILGLGIDLGNFLMDLGWEWQYSAMSRSVINSNLVDGHKPYRGKQLAFKVCYNLLG